MARPRSEDRRTALVQAAIRVFAERGISAPTAVISKTAKVSEGTFFTYFATKDDLVVAVYRELRLDLAAAIMNGFPRKASIRGRLEHVWARYVGWGTTNPVARRALRVAGMANAVTPAIRDENGSIFAELDRLQVDAFNQKRLHVPDAMASQALKALAEMTMDLIEKDPAQARLLTASGFEMLWGALTAKPAK